MRIIGEFKEFVQRGNVVDMAVGLIMGAAFGKIVNSLVADVLMPPVGYVIGGVKFTELKASLPAVTVRVPNPSRPGELMDRTLEAASINYGSFLQTAFDFLIIAFCVFLLVKGINLLRRKQAEKPAEPAAPTPQEKLLMEIRDLLKSRTPQ